MNISTDGVIITKRFFFAIEVLISRRIIRGMQTFTKAHDINYWNLSTVKKEPEKRIFKPEWLTYLVTDYNVSADWLLTGRGAMFSDSGIIIDEKTVTTHHEQ